MILSEIDISRLPSCINVAFDGDTDLFEKYHIHGKDLKSCVDHTYETIYKTSLEYGLKFYEIVLQGVTIGYTVLLAGLGDTVLYSFGINKAYRRSGLLREWILAIDLLINGSYSCMLWSKNERAIRFLEKNGMEIIATNDNTTTLLKKKKTNLCQ